MMLLLPGTEHLPHQIAFALATRPRHRHWIEDASGELWTYDQDTETAYPTLEIEVACEWCDGACEVEVATAREPFALRPCRPCGGHGIDHMIPDGEWIAEMIAWAERRAAAGGDR